jgi:CDP-diacylglycerol--glycerol-3-phosphate 3-phosphatidyltransferase
MAPNTLTLLGFLFNIIVAWVLAQGHLFLGGFLVIICSAFDLLDGALARVTGRVTAFGAILDSTLDRFSEAALLFGLSVFYLVQYRIPEVLLIYVVLVGSLAVSYVRARAEGLGLECEVGLLARPERVIILALGLIFNQVLIALWILAVLTHVTVGQRLLHLWRQTRKGKPSGQG